MKKYTVTNLTPDEFTALKSEGKSFKRCFDEYFLDGEDYILVKYPPFENEHGYRKHPLTVTYQST